MRNSTETIAHADGRSFGAYVSHPSQSNGHAVIVLQEIFGVTAHIRGVADRFAEDGFLAYAPDLFWRVQPGIELSHSNADIAQAMALLAQYRDNDGLQDIAQTVAHLRAKTDFQGRIAVAGLCLGGKLAYLSATLPGVDAAIGFYGVGIENHLDAAPRLRCPLMLHFGDQDPYVPEAARHQVQEALKGTSAQLHLYPGANHGFYTRGAEADMALAHQRSRDFLTQVFDAKP